MAKLRVGVNGYGTIGKRVADAVANQSDMTLIGVSKRTPDYEAQSAALKGLEIYTPGEDAASRFKTAGFSVAGTVSEMISRCDVVVDCTPEGVGAENKRLYAEKGVRAVFQGGEPPGVADASFVAEVNYDEAFGKRYVRVVSCNTTGLSRTLGALNRVSPLKKVKATIVRRAADPAETKKGPLNALIPNPAKFPSHHGPDVSTVIHGVPIVTAAIVAPTTLMHVHVVYATLSTTVTRESVLEELEKSMRIRVVEAARGLDSTAALMEFARDLGRGRGDMPEVVVWRESLSVDRDEVYYIQAVHQESIVVPENVDAIRASAARCSKEESVRLTNASLGLSR